MENIVAQCSIQEKIRCVITGR